jgi:hypothetical protein
LIEHIHIFSVKENLPRPLGQKSCKKDFTRGKSERKLKRSKYMQLKIGQRYKRTSDYAIIIVEITNASDNMFDREGIVRQIISDKLSTYNVGYIGDFYFENRGPVTYQYLEGQDACS